MKSHALQLSNVKRSEQSDIIGALASGLCLVHCLATPFLFLANACSTACCSAAADWWGYIDYLFLAVSFTAIHFTKKGSSSKWIAKALYIAWLCLLLVVLNEGFEIAALVLPEEAVYIPALALIALYLYNRKYCRCQKQQYFTN